MERVGFLMRDEDLIRIVDAAVLEAGQRAGSWLVCRPGCTECCIGPFPINALDAERLRRGLTGLERADPHRAERVRARAGAAAAAMLPFAEDEEAVTERFAAMPCPALDPDSGLCDLYEWRPVTCRTFGPPVRFAGEPMPPCRLCFGGAAPEEVERCRVEVDPGDLEGALLEEMRAPGQTLIAFALIS